MIEEFYCFDIQWKIVVSLAADEEQLVGGHQSTVCRFYFVVEEIDWMRVQFQWQRFQKGYVVGRDLFIAEIEFMYNYIIHMIIG